MIGWSGPSGPGVSLANGLERIQGRLSATHKALDNRMRLGVNVTTSRVNTTEEFADALRDAFGKPGPHLIDAVVPSITG